MLSIAIAGVTALSRSGNYVDSNKDQTNVIINLKRIIMVNNNWLTIEQEGQRVILRKCEKVAEGEIIIPDGVTDIGAGAFDGCDKITLVHIPNGVQTIGGHAFLYCNELKTVHIPATVISIQCSGLDDAPFYGDANITAITVDKDNPVYDSRDNCNAIIETATNRLLVGCQNTKIPNTVEIIVQGSFFCFNLPHNIIPESVKLVERYAFYYCFIPLFVVQSNRTKIYQTSFRIGDTTIIRDYNLIHEGRRKHLKYSVYKYPGLIGFEINTRSFVKYYTSCFYNQLKTYFYHVEDNNTYIKIQSVDINSNERWADEMPGRDIKENFMFASTFLYMTVAGQSIMKYAADITEDFHRCTGWSQICSDLDQSKLSHPLEILRNADLYPMKYESALFLEFVKKVFGFLRQEINTLLNGKTFPMKDVVAGKRFTESIDGHKRSNIKRYLNRQEKGILEFLGKWATSSQKTWDDFLKDEGIKA
jgi:hypothetical protein